MGWDGMGWDGMWRDVTGPDGTGRIERFRKFGIMKWKGEIGMGTEKMGIE